MKTGGVNPNVFAQDELPFVGSIAPHTVFPGRTVLRCHEVARVMGCTARHIADLCAEGTIRGATNIAGENNRGNPSFWRIPVDAYEAWIKRRSNLDVEPFRPRR